jgi:glycosyltransferase involved in cell wall biosynthesis
MAIDSESIFLSIIVPVFNQDPVLLKRALKSAAEQKDAPRYEVIVVDDGSKETKTTADLCSTYGARYLPLEHQGLSGARDSGILASEGTYIAFLDSDDYLSDQFVNFAFRACQIKPFEVVLFGNTSSELVPYSFSPDTALVFDDSNEILRLFNRLDRINPGVEIRSSWAKAFNRAFLITSNLLYPRDLECQGEDHIMMLNLSTKAKLIGVFAPYQLYHYELSPQSVSSSYNPKNLSRFLALINAWRRFLVSTKAAPAKYEEFYYTVSGEYLEQLLALLYCNPNNPAPKRERFKSAKRDLFTAPDFHEAIQKAKVSSCPSRLKKLNLIALKLHLYRLMFHHYEAKRMK